MNVTYQAYHVTRTSTRSACGMPGVSGMAMVKTVLPLGHRYRVMLDGYSNWELSAARAGSVVRVLQGHGVGPERLAVIGYGDQRPLQSNDSEQGRNANRRVVVVILSTELARIGLAAPAGPRRASAA